MGTKVTIFTWLMLIIGLTFDHITFTSLFFNLSWITALYKNFKIWNFTNKFPGYHFAKNFTTFFRSSSLSFYCEINKLWMQHGRDKFSTWIGFERFLTVSKLNDVKAVLNETQDEPFVEHFNQMWPWLGGDDIKSSDFSSKSLIAAFVDGNFNKFTKSDSFMKSLNKKITSLCEENIMTDDIDIQGVIRQLTFDVVYGLALGDETVCKRSMLFKAGEELCDMADQRIFCGWKQNKFLRRVFGEEWKFANYRKSFAECVKKVIDERCDDNSRADSCLLDVLITDGRLNQTEIISTLIGFIVLGYDRLSSSTCLALLDLAKRDNIQENIFDEIKQFESNEDHSSMPLLEGLILESQRLRPAVPLITKWTNVGIPLVGFFVPAESSVLLYLNGTSRDVNHFTNPDNFNINRPKLGKAFGSNQNEQSLPMTFTKTVLENLVKRYRLKLDSESLGYGITTRPISCKIHFEPL